MVEARSQYTSEPRLNDTETPPQRRRGSQRRPQTQGKERISPMEGLEDPHEDVRMGGPSPQFHPRGRDQNNNLIQMRKNRRPKGVKVATEAELTLHSILRYRSKEIKCVSRCAINKHEPLASE